MRWNAINKRIKNIENPIGVEIGVFRGENSKNLLDLHPTLKLYMIDAWSDDTYNGKDEQAVSDRYREIYTDGAIENYKTTRKNVENYIIDRAFIISEFSEKAVKFFNDEYFDFVFIDAAHDEKSVKQDIEMWLPKVKKGGWICGHDYGVEDFTGVKMAVDNFIENSIIELNLEIDEDFTWFIKL